MADTSEYFLANTGPVPDGIGDAPNDKLFNAILAQVKKDGFKKDAILPSETLDRNIQTAAEVIYYDVEGFHYWYFDQDDDRTQFLATQKKAAIPGPISAVVRPVVQDNIDEMRSIGDIPAGLDSDSLVNVVTDNLSRYILNWQDWYYVYKAQDEIDDFQFDKALYNEIYVDGGYGDLSNLSNYTDSDVDDPFDETK